MIVRRARVEDAGAIALVHVSTWQHAYRGIVPQRHLDQLSVEDREKAWVEIIEHGGSETLVADSRGQIVGFISYGSSRTERAVRGEGEVYAIYVVSSHWSKGVGWALWQSALTRLRELRFSRVIVWVLAGNERAIRFYERIGFSHSEGNATSVEIRGDKLPELRYDIAIG